MVKCTCFTLEMTFSFSGCMFKTLLICIILVAIAKGASQIWSKLVVHHFLCYRDCRDCLIHGGIFSVTSYNHIILHKSLEHSGVPIHCFIYRTVNVFLHCDHNMTGEPRVTATGNSTGSLFVRNCITKECIFRVTTFGNLSLFTSNKTVVCMVTGCDSPYCSVCGRSDKL